MSFNIRLIKVKTYAEVSTKYYLRQKMVEGLSEETAYALAKAAARISINIAHDLPILQDTARKLARDIHSCISENGLCLSYLPADSDLFMRRESDSANDILRKYSINTIPIGDHAFLHIPEYLDQTNTNELINACISRVFEEDLKTRKFE